MMLIQTIAGLITAALGCLFIGVLIGLVVVGFQFVT